MNRPILSIAAMAAVTTTAPLAAQLTIQGVYVDSEGVLRSRKTVDKDTLQPDPRERESFSHLSLPRLFEKLRALEGRAPTERMQYLDGIVRLQYVYLDGQDLIIAGPSEPWHDAEPDGRVRGKRTGRPVLQLDDLIVALRSLGPGGRTRAFGCTLQQRPESFKKLERLQAQLRRLRRADPRDIARLQQEALGPLDARVFGVSGDTRYAQVCLEADYIMKRLSLGLDRVPPRILRSYFSRSTGGHLFNRFWFTVEGGQLTAAANGTAFEIGEYGLQLQAGQPGQASGTQNAAASAFARQFTKSLPELERLVPAFADLHNLADVAVLAALIADDRLDERVGWDLNWILEEGSFATREHPVTESAQPLVNQKSGGRRVVTVAGGVTVQLRPILQHRARGVRRRPSMAIPEGQWVARQ